MEQHLDVTAAVEDALRAPSVHNTQPWRWRIGPDQVELYADWDRQLVATDPDRRDLLLSCGAALHHLLVALAARGLVTTVARFPDPEDSGHLATVTFHPATVEEVDTGNAALYPGIATRRTDRRRMSHRTVPPDYVQALQDHATQSGAVLVHVTEPAVRRGLLNLLVDASEQQRMAPGYAAELRTWTNRLPGGHDGVPEHHVSTPLPGPDRPSVMRRFGRTALAQPHLRPGHTFDDAAELLVIATDTDDASARLRAGEATSAVLLAATRLGLATTPLSQALEIDATRHQMRTGVLKIPEQPQLVIRVGWPATGAAVLPPTPRRSLESVLAH
jgi:nitroreductase